MNILYPFKNNHLSLTSRVNSLSVALRASYLSVRTAEGTSEKQSSLKLRLSNGLTYLLIRGNYKALYL